MTTNDTILVTAATGKTGRRVVALLEERGIPVRAGSRRTTPAFDWEDSSTWPAALEGVGAVYVVLPHLGSPECVEQLREFAALAAQAGVRKAVMLSVPADGGMDPEALAASEQQLPDAGIPVTTLRLRWFSQNFSEDFLLDAVVAGDIRVPAGEGREAFIDADDIAAVAVEALTDDAHDGADLELTGPRSLSFADIAEILTRATGRSINYTSRTPDEFVAEQVAAGVPPEFAEMLGGVYVVIASGSLDSTTSDVETVLGRPARDFADYAAEAAATGIWSRES